LKLLFKDVWFAFLVGFAAGAVLFYGSGSNEVGDCSAPAIYLEPKDHGYEIERNSFQPISEQREAETDGKGSPCVLKIGLLGRPCGEGIQ